jgi:hypothetical protein
VVVVVAVLLMAVLLAMVVTESFIYITKEKKCQ